MTVIENPARPEVQAIFLKAHLKLAKVGMRHSTLTKTDLLRKASAVTGKKYSSRSAEDLVRAIADLQMIVDTATGVAPVSSKEN
jgi:hypothetical protein